MATTIKKGTKKATITRGKDGVDRNVDPKKAPKAVRELRVYTQDAHAALKAASSAGVCKGWVILADAGDMTAYLGSASAEQQVQFIGHMLESLDSRHPGAAVMALLMMTAHFKGKE